MTTFGNLFVQKRPVKDGYQNFVQNCAVREVNFSAILGNVVAPVCLRLMVSIS